MCQPPAEVAAYGPVTESLSGATQRQTTERNVPARVGEGFENDVLSSLAGGDADRKVHHRREPARLATALDEEQKRLFRYSGATRNRTHPRRRGGRAAESVFVE